VQALAVSKHVSNDNAIPSPASTTFGSTSSDLSAFRLEVEDPAATTPTIDVTLDVGGRGAITYTLSFQQGHRYRGVFIRLVSDSVDDAVLGTQTVLAKLADDAVLSYGGRTRTVRVARPVGENNNAHPDPLRHDIREVRLSIKVFSRVVSTNLSANIDATVTTIPVNYAKDAHPAGSILIGSEVIEYTTVTPRSGGGWDFGGCTRGAQGTTAAPHSQPSTVRYSRREGSIARSQIVGDVTRIEERLAQSAIRVKRPYAIDRGPGLYGYPCPGLWLAGDAAFDAQPVLIPAPVPQFFNAAIPYISGDRNVLDILYLGSGVGTGALATAYPAARNLSGNPTLSNWIAVNSAASRADPLTMPHELMHILLNSPHRGDPTTALFYASSTGPGVTGTRRIGPYPDAASAGVGFTDTRTIRVAAESLP
jgi:hypothetical protein